MSKIKRGKFYRFCNNDAKIDFLAEVYNQFGIDLAKSCFDFYMKCEALAVSNSQDTILYRTKIKVRDAVCYIAPRGIGYTIEEAQEKIIFVDRIREIRKRNNKVRYYLRNTHRGFDESELFSYEDKAKFDKMLSELNRNH